MTTRTTDTATGSGKYELLIERTQDIPAVPTAAAHPCDEVSLAAAIEAALMGIITPFLVGPEQKMRAVARKFGLDLSPYELIDAPHSQAAAAKAVELVRLGRAELLMKGSLHTDELLGEVVKRDTVLGTARRISYVFIMDVPTYHRPLMITRAAVNTAPTLEEKRDILQKAIDLAIVLGLERPKVAILSAVETVSPKIPTTLEAAALCKLP